MEIQGVCYCLVLPVHLCGSSKGLRWWGLFTIPIYILKRTEPSPYLQIWPLIQASPNCKHAQKLSLISHSCFLLTWKHYRFGSVTAAAGSFLKGHLLMYRNYTLPGLSDLELQALLPSVSHRSCLGAQFNQGKSRRRSSLDIVQKVLTPFLLKLVAKWSSNHSFSVQQGKSSCVSCMLANRLLGKYLKKGPIESIK